MARIKELLIELKYEVFKNILLITFLKSIIAFYIFYMIGSLIDLWYMFSFIFAGAYFVYSLIKKMRKIRIKVFEEHNPEIKEMLTTAADNIDKDNIVMNELFKDVIQNVKKLSSGTLIVPKNLLILIIIIPILAVASFEIQPLRIDAISQDRIIEGLQQIKFIEGLFNNTGVDIDIDTDGLFDADIFGNRRIATLGDQEIDIRMNLGMETDLTKPRPEDTEQVRFRDFPDTNNNQELIDDGITRNNQPIQDSRLAREYNEKVRNMR
ncbi:MAG: hypothetical protein ACMXYG_06630 [Candidatus Woesearchaeota archaeon]